MEGYEKQRIIRAINRFQRFDSNKHHELFDELLVREYWIKQSDFPELAIFLSGAQVELANCVLPLNKSISGESKLESLLKNLEDTLADLFAFDRTIRDEANYKLNFDNSFPNAQITHAIRALPDGATYWKAPGPGYRFNEKLLKEHPMFSVEPVARTGSITSFTTNSSKITPDIWEPPQQHSSLSNATYRLSVVQAGTPDSGQEAQVRQQSTPQAEQAGRKHYTVFVSSTFEDMKDIRAAVLGMLYSTEDFMPIGMENFTASDSSQLDYIRERLDDTDIYVLLLGGRYGTLTPRGDRSYTHEEYEMAKANPAVRVLSFVCEHPENLPGKRRWQNDEERDNLRKFTEEVEKNSMVKLWNADTSPEKIAINVLQSVVKVKETETLRGWIRG